MNSIWALVQDDLEEWDNCATPDCFLKICPWGPDPTVCYPCNEKAHGRNRMRVSWNMTHDTPWTPPKYPEGQGHKWMAEHFSMVAERYDRMRARRGLSDDDVDVRG